MGARRPRIPLGHPVRPLYRQLAIARERRDVFVVDPVLAGAVALISALSLPLVLDRLIPQLAAALDG